MNSGELSLNLVAAVSFLLSLYAVKRLMDSEATFQQKQAQNAIELAAVQLLVRELRESLAKLAARFENELALNQLETGYYTEQVNPQTGAKTYVKQTELQASSMSAPGPVDQIRQAEEWVMGGRKL